ncbi:hypothetical protein GCM10011380_21630 [Sphingomonas metalli]|uniref:Uncharacterized protein n=1 Tax=Sphingomonas metalli TaxID=1779358 RepID=A0A916T5U5_9SPHN|nr:hypothetical protein [Sphingomonas metalli]GGB31900.1 hypothetical protein GCM10011380_21630 [Sphingomonas metalli]
MAVIGLLVFTGAFALSVAVIAMAVAPQWRRILRLAFGRPDEAFTPLRTLAHAERRIAVRRWASAPIPAPIRRLREVA